MLIISTTKPSSSARVGKFSSLKYRFKLPMRRIARIAVTAQTTQTARLLINATWLTSMNGTKTKRFSKPTSSVESYQIRREARKMAVATNRIS